MKKSFFYLAACALALSACSTEELVKEDIQQTNAIGFQNVIKKSTRAEGEENGPVVGDLTQDQFKMFLVYGYYTKSSMEAYPVQIFDKDVVSKHEVEKDGEKTSVWTYDNTRYWIPDATYYFYAYSCADIALSKDKGEASMAVANGTTLDARALKINNYVCNSNHQHDLITAVNEGIKGLEKNNQEVKFTFKHALCKVSADFINEFPEGYEIRISDVKLQGFYDKGNCLLRNGTDSEPLLNVWSKVVDATRDNTSISMVIEEGKDVAVDETEVTTASVFMLPLNYTNENGGYNVNVTLEFTLSVSQKDTDGKPHEFLKRTITGSWQPNWVSGTAYNYNVRITGNTAKLEPIVFETSQAINENDGTNKWIEDKEVDMSFDIAE